MQKLGVSLCKDSAHEIPCDLLRNVSGEEPPPRFKQVPPLQKFVPGMNRSSDCIVRSLCEETRHRLCLSFQFCKCGTAFPTKIKVGSNSTHLRVVHFAVQICEKVFIVKMLA